MKAKKILILNTIGMGYEGISSVIINYMGNMNLENILIVIIVYNNTPDKLKMTLNKFGTTYQIPLKKKNIIGYIKSLLRIMKTEKPDVIHIHGNSGTMFVEAFLAKIFKISKILIHCHNTTCMHPFINLILKKPMKCLATDLMSCSLEAGKWLYGRSSYIVLNNAIDLLKFEYNEETRYEYRKLFAIENNFVIGHIGSFNKQKNHDFLIDVFYELHKKNDTCKLLLVSDGSEYKKIKDKVRTLKLENSVIFAGRRSDVDKLYQAMDIFVMPSLWEGLPVVMLEAQAAGLPLLVSDNITYEAKCTEQTEYLSLDYGPQYWAEKIIEIKNKGYIRNSKASAEVRQHGFDIKIEADKLRYIYLS